MRKIALILGVVALLSACNDKVKTKYLTNVPVYTDYETFRSSGAFNAPKNIEKKGAIYIYEQFLYIVEPDKGIHFIDNSDPSSPQKIGFLDLIGATGMAIKDNYLYANSFIDLVVFDISTIHTPKKVARLENVFPTALPVSEFNYPYEAIDKELGVVTSWEVEKVEERLTYQNPAFVNCFECEVFTTTNFDSGVNNEGTTTGIAGSTAKFAILDEVLYVMEEERFLNPFDISTPTTPIELQDSPIGGTIETLFPYKGFLFMGTPTGMLIYSVVDPENPTNISRFSHARGCDPVVVQGDYAYVTVRSGGRCGSAENVLSVINISNINAPFLEQNFLMENPHGLGIDGNSLFICDGEAGLKVFDASNPVESGNKLTHHFDKIQATDIIPYGNNAILVGDDGIFQYDYSNPAEMILISEIKF